MNAAEAISSSLAATQHVLGLYLNDLGDADFLVRPIPGANHIAWQIGHLIVSERNLVRESLPTANYPELPAGFAEAHAMPRAADDTGFATKAVYVDLFNKTRAATIANVKQLSDADLDKPTSGRMAQFAPKLGHLFNLVNNHTLMHGGQFSVLRRKLGKPNVM